MFLIFGFNGIIIVFDKQVSEAVILEVLDKVGLTAFYSTLPKGLSTEVGERGAQLSGGERQRLALARVLFSYAKIIILDEAISAMDTVIEELVMKNVMLSLKGKTIISIAHRLNTIKDADEIYVFKTGKIVDNGCFKELLENSPYFQQLWATNLES